MAKVKLSPKKSQWVKGRTTKLKGHPLNYNVSQQIKYSRALRKLTVDMINETQGKILALFKTQKSKSYFKQQKKVAMDENISDKSNKVLKALTSKFTQLFNSNAESLAKEMVSGAKSTSKTSLQSSLKKLAGVELDTGVVPKGMESVSQAIINENVSLIKSIPQEYLNDISGSVMRSITTGNGLASLIPDIKKNSDQTDRRVKNLALDQTRKAYNAINKQRMQNVGVKKFEWLHTSGSAEPRKSHQEISGNVYSFDDLPLKGKEGFVNGQYPGQAINCRCVMIPVIEFDDGDKV